MINYIPLDPKQDATRVLDLCERACDYIQLETGKYPDADYVQETLTDKPPQLGEDDIFLTGVENADKSLVGLVTNIRHFYEKNEWYMGLMLLDPKVRGRGLGHHAANHVFQMVQAQNAICIRIAVLYANPRALKFWKTLGFKNERTVEDCPDGHVRHVLRKPL